MEKTLTESEKIEQLMKPRYKVIADYPNQYYSTGHIVTELFCDDEYKDESFFEQYPAIFKRLEWWEERTPEEMPEYVKLNPENTTGGPEVFKVMDVKQYADGIVICHTSPPDEISPFEQYVGANYFLPATEAEYNEYLTHSQAGER